MDIQIGIVTKGIWPVYKERNNKAYSGKTFIWGGDCGYRLEACNRISRPADNKHFKPLLSSIIEIQHLIFKGSLYLSKVSHLLKGVHGLRDLVGRAKRP